jgi:hypothetical protein
MYRSLSMPDLSSSVSMPRDWGEAFAALPQERPTVDGWARVAARLDVPPRSRWPIWLATAAALVLAAALPWQWHRDHATSAAPTAQPIVAGTDALEQLYAESAQLEAVLAMARDERVSSGAAAALAGDLDRQLASIDAALMQPGLSRAEQLALWQQRVEALRSVVSFEGTRRWLAAQGERYDGALVSID